MQQITSWTSSVVGHMTDPGFVLAHQGGWDEMLMVVVPVATFAGLLYVANRRASKLSDRPVGTPDDDASASEHRTPGRRAPEPRNERGGPI
jgi:hypothetical protein